MPGEAGTPGRVNPTREKEIERARVRVGQVVTSRAGRDAGRLYLVVGWREDGRVLVADGEGRSVKRPKPKNVRHLWVHSVWYTDPVWVADDRHVREALARFRRDQEAEDKAGEAREGRATENGTPRARKGGERDGRESGDD